MKEMAETTSGCSGAEAEIYRAVTAVSPLFGSQCRVGPRRP